LPAVPDATSCFPKEHRVTLARHIMGNARIRASSMQPAPSLRGPAGTGTSPVSKASATCADGLPADPSPASSATRPSRTSSETGLHSGRLPRKGVPSPQAVKWRRRRPDQVQETPTVGQLFNLNNH
jgi:hypothetical protein